MNQPTELQRLAARVEELNKEVHQLRGDFEDHLKIEDQKYNELKASLNQIQSKVDQLLVEIKEPLDSYKAAKYGMGFLKYLVETAKWLAPLIVGALIAWGVPKPLEKIQDPIPIEIIDKASK